MPAIFAQCVSIPPIICHPSLMPLIWSSCEPSFLSLWHASTYLFPHFCHLVLSTCVQMCRFNYCNLYPFFVCRSLLSLLICPLFFFIFCYQLTSCKHFLASTFLRTSLFHHQSSLCLPNLPFEIPKILENK